MLGVLEVGVEKEISTSASDSGTCDIVYCWMGIAMRMSQKRLVENQTVKSVCTIVREKGFRCCVLKGVSMARYYPEPWRRQMGDIDLWIDADDDSIIRSVRTFSPNSNPVYHNIQCIFPEMGSVELHYRPTWLYNPIHNKRLQQFYNSCREECFNKNVDKIYFPTLRFDRVFILMHIYRHLFSGGIGLRQMLDYYYVLRQGMTPEDREATLDIFASLRMKRFVGATMYVLQEMFGLEEAYLLTQPDSRRGRLLLEEILSSSNFGKINSSMQKWCKTALGRFVWHCWRGLHFIFQYPSEVLWLPLWKIWHQWWKWRHK